MVRSPCTLLCPRIGDAPLFEKFYVGDYTDLRHHRALDLRFIPVRLLPAHSVEAVRRRARQVDKLHNPRQIRAQVIPKPDAKSGGHLALARRMGGSGIGPKAAVKRPGLRNMICVTAPSRVFTRHCTDCV